MADKKSERKKILDAITRQDILDTTVKIITRHGLNGLTMDKIATEARVAKGTLYIHFQNKHEVVEAAIESSIAPLIEKLQDMLDGDYAPGEKLRHFTLYNLQFFDSNKELYRVLLYDDELSSEDTKRYRSDYYWTVVRRVALVVDDGMKQGVFTPADPMKVAIMFVEANRAITVQRFSRHDSRDIGKDADLIADVFMHGISARTGKEHNRRDNDEGKENP